MHLTKDVVYGLAHHVLECPVEQAFLCTIGQASFARFYSLAFEVVDHLIGSPDRVLDTLLEDLAGKFVLISQKLRYGIDVFLRTSPCQYSVDVGLASILQAVPLRLVP